MCYQCLQREVELFKGWQAKVAENKGVVAPVGGRI
jgi:hypothetical protein